MWIIWGIVFLLFAAVRSISYAVWLWEQNQHRACFGVTLLTALSLGIPIFVATWVR